MIRKDLHLFLGCGCLILILLVTPTIKEDTLNYLQHNVLIRLVVEIVLSLALVIIGVTYVNLAFAKEKILYNGKSPLHRFSNNGE